MANYEVTVVLTVSVSNPSIVKTLGAGAADERAQVEAAVNLGLKELAPIASRYGFTISDSRADVATV